MSLSMSVRRRFIQIALSISGDECGCDWSIETTKYDTIFNIQRKKFINRISNYQDYVFEEQKQESIKTT